MNYEKKADDIIKGLSEHDTDSFRKVLIEMAIKQAYKEGFMDCMNKMMATLKIEIEKEGK